MVDNLHKLKIELSKRVNNINANNSHGYDDVSILIYDKKPINTTFEKNPQNHIYSILYLSGIDERDVFIREISGKDNSINNRIIKQIKNDEIIGKNDIIERVLWIYNTYDVQT